MKLRTLKKYTFIFIVFAIIISSFTSVLANPSFGSLLFLPLISKQEPPSPTPTSTPTDTPTPTSTQIPPLTPTLSPTALPEGVIVLSSNYYYPYSGSSYLYIVGEVLNNTQRNVGWVEIYATLRDANGNVVGSDWSFSDISILMPNMKSPFLILVDVPPSWASYELDIAWERTSDRSYNLEILNYTSYFDSYNDFHVTGEIRNQYDDNMSYIKAVVTMYDISGKVIGREWNYTNPDDLVPGQTASFHVPVYSWKGYPNRSSIGSYTVQVIDDW